MSWTPIATHGQSEEQVRAALLEQAEVLLNRWRSEQRAEGVPLHEIEAVAAVAKRVQAEQIERDLPAIMCSLAISASAARMH